VVRLARVFKHPKRSLILLGHGGTGRQSLVRLASHCCQVHFIHYLTPYAHNELASMKHELVSALKMAGLSGQAVCFFLKDAAASNSRFLTFVNQILQVTRDFVPIDPRGAFQISPGSKNLSANLPETLTASQGWRAKSWY